MVDLDAVRARYSRALDAKPGKGDYAPDGIAAITDSVCDIPDLLAEIERLAASACGVVPWTEESATEGRELISMVSDRAANYIERGRSSMPINLDEAAALLVIASDHLERHQQAGESRG